MNTRKQTQNAAKVLESLYVQYNHREFIGDDPLQFVYKYSEPADMEIAGFFASALAYGRVKQISASVSRLLAIMGSSPADFTYNFTERQRPKLKTFKHRFNTGDDIADLLVLLRQVLRKYGSIENFFLAGYHDSDENVIPALTTFCGQLEQMYKRKHHGKLSRSLMYLLANPSRKSACKRLFLFLRWMVRDDRVDAGLWKSVDKSKLVVPVDVHMARLCGIMGLHHRNDANLKTALEITENFVKILPEDPVKYDFALSRIGIIENCTGKMNDKCKHCRLYGYCIER